MRVLCTGGSGFIGTSLIDRLLGERIEVINIDIKRPLQDSHLICWKQGDILNYDELNRLFEEFQPTHIVHLAARADIQGTSLEDYQANTEGTSNVLEATRVTLSVERIIVTSTQFVHRPEHLPDNDEDFEPYTVYGQSKIIAEQLTRSAGLGCVWTIIRPTVIWGPWHPVYPYELWQIIKKRQYLHPGKKPVIRSYGYVGNIVFQIQRILEAPSELVNRKVYYLGDMPMNQLDWVNSFSRVLTGQNVWVVPRSVLRALAVVGDALQVLGIKFPMHTARFRRMTEDYPTPMTSTIEAFGQLPYSLQDGVHETVQWLRCQGLV